MAESTHRTPQRRMPARTKSNFQARAAIDENARLARRGSIVSAQQSTPGEEVPLLPDATQATGVTTAYGSTEGREGIRARNSFFPSFLYRTSDLQSRTRSSKRRSSRQKQDGSGGTQSETSKLGTFGGVFVPTSLNVLSILMFLRFGFIIGQGGLLGTLGMLVACYAINLLTTMSISAIATNGTVRGGGAYYLISRSLGPEFGGSIGIVFYLGSVFNTGLNAVGLIDCFIENFGVRNGNWDNWMPDTFWWKYLWATMVLLICTAICLAGSGLFAKASNALLVVVLVATLSIPISACIMHPFVSGKQGIEFTGVDIATLRENLFPHFTRGAAGSQLKGRENFQDLFGILFPATGGIFAGASMSGDLKNPSKAIPKGTLYGLVLTFFTYALVVLAMAASITRASFHNNTNVIQLTSISQVAILMGEFATTFFSSLMGVIGSAKLLQALARDNLIPGFSFFGMGTKKTDEPLYAIFITYVLAQLTMLFDINQIASLITMAYLMTFLVTNLACFLLKISSAPNFRPSFNFFNWQTAAVGTVASGASMFFVDGVYASACVAVLIALFAIIHFTTPPKPWGDVSQGLIYHQVRKYLLRLRQEHVKFWRPQILLLINDPRKHYKLIQFCNSLKKGSLFILGHVIVTQDFAGSVPEARQQQVSWTKYIDFSRIKAFVNIAISPALEWGTRNLILGAGLGSMRPNVVVMGFYNLGELRETVPLADLYAADSSPPLTDEEDNAPTAARGTKKQTGTGRLSGRLPTDTMRRESSIEVTSYMTVLEDLLLQLKINVAVAKGFDDLDLPPGKPSKARRFLRLLTPEPKEEDKDKYIDLWPIQMSAEFAAAEEHGQPRQNITTTNFDTYTLILQLGAIITTVPSWKRYYRLRVAVFVEYESDVEEERQRVTALLETLRIQAKVFVFWLASGDIKSYEIIINGNTDGNNADDIRYVDDALSNEDWWQDVEALRGRRETMDDTDQVSILSGMLDGDGQWPEASFQYGRQEFRPSRFLGLRKLLRKASRRSSVSHLSQLGVSMGMRTQRLSADLISGHSESSDEVSSSDADDEADSAGESAAIESDTGSDDYPASENDVASLSAASDSSRPVTPLRRAVSTGDAIDVSRSPSLAKSSPAPTHPDDAQPVRKDFLRSRVSETSTKTQSTSSKATSRAGSAPRHLRKRSMPKFSSKPVPKPKMAEGEQGPSIMFDMPSPELNRAPQQSIYDRAARAAIAGTPTSSRSRSRSVASGFPSQQSVPLSFNDLPCRAQHLILNELMRKHTQDTAVLFTTLPSPTEGTCKSESDSIKYLSDLEILCHGLPPMLLIHSNSMTVTTNL